MFSISMNFVKVDSFMSNLSLNNDIHRLIIVKLTKDDIENDFKECKLIAENARKILNYSLVSKAWQEHLKDCLIEKKWIFIDKKNDLLINIKYLSSNGSVPLVRELDPSLCEIQGPSCLFKLLAVAGAKTPWICQGAGEKAPPLNLNELQEACRLFPEATIAEHLSAEGHYGSSPCLFQTKISLLSFACQLYMERNKQDFPLKAIEILLENGAKVDLNKNSHFHFSCSPGYVDHREPSIIELLDDYLTSLRETSIISPPDSLSEIIEVFKNTVVEKLNDEKVKKEIDNCKDKLNIISKLGKLKQLIIQNGGVDTQFLLEVEDLVVKYNSYLKRNFENFLSHGSIYEERMNTTSIIRTKPAIQKDDLVLSTTKCGSSPIESKELPSSINVSVEFDTGFGNSLVLCGNGGGLSWDPSQGIPLKCTGKSQWTISIPSDVKEFKLVQKTKNGAFKWEKLDGNHSSGSVQFPLKPKF